jgi:hypothetical protein
LFFCLHEKYRFFEKSGTIGEREVFFDPGKIPAVQFCYALAQHTSGNRMMQQGFPALKRDARAKKPAVFCGTHQ